MGVHKRLVLGAAVIACLALAGVLLSRGGGDREPPPDATGGTAREPKALPRPVLRLGPGLPEGDFWLEQFFPVGAVAGTRVYLHYRPGEVEDVRLGIGDRRVELHGDAGGDIPGGPGSLRRIIVRRRGRRLEVAAVGAESLAPKILFVHEHPRARGTSPGRTAVETPPGAARPPAPRVQPLGEIDFSDDFARAEPEGAWKPLAGRWELSRYAFSENSAWSRQSEISTSRTAARAAESAAFCTSLAARA